MHANHLLHYIERERKFKDIANVVAIADGGPDWNHQLSINEIVDESYIGHIHCTMLCPRTFEVQPNRKNVVISNKQDCNSDAARRHRWS